MNDKIRIDNTNMYMHIPYSAAKAIDEYMKKNKKINAVKVLREVLRDAGEHGSLKVIKDAIEKKYHPSLLNAHAHNIVVFGIPENPMDTLIRMLNGN